LKNDRVIKRVFFKNLGRNSLKSMKKGSEDLFEGNIQFTPDYHRIKALFKSNEYSNYHPSLFKASFQIPEKKYTQIRALCKKYNLEEKTNDMAWFDFFTDINKDVIPHEIRSIVKESLERRTIIDNYNKGPRKVELTITDNFNNHLSVRGELVKEIIDLLDQHFPQVAEEDKRLVNRKVGSVTINNHRDDAAYRLNLYLEKFHKKLEKKEINGFIYQYFEIIGHPFKRRHSVDNCNDYGLVGKAIGRYKKKL